MGFKLRKHGSGYRLVNGFSRTAETGYVTVEETIREQESAIAGIRQYTRYESLHDVGFSEVDLVLPLDTLPRSILLFHGRADPLISVGAQFDLTVKEGFDSLPKTILWQYHLDWWFNRQADLFTAIQGGRTVAYCTNLSSTFRSLLIAEIVGVIETYQVKLSGDSSHLSITTRNTKQRRMILYASDAAIPATPVNWTHFDTDYTTDNTKPTAPAMDWSWLAVTQPGTYNLLSGTSGDTTSYDNEHLNNRELFSILY